MKAILILKTGGPVQLEITNYNGFIDSALLARLDPRFDVVQIPFKLGFIPLKLSDIQAIYFENSNLVKTDNPIITLEEAREVYANK